MRGLMFAKETGCHIINMSYGEPSCLANHGRFVRLAEEIVNKHGLGKHSNVCDGLCVSATRKLSKAYVVLSLTCEKSLWLVLETVDPHLAL